MFYYRQRYKKRLENGNKSSDLIFFDNVFLTLCQSWQGENPVVIDIDRHIAENTILVRSVDCARKVFLYFDGTFVMDNCCKEWNCCACKYISV